MFKNRILKKLGAGLMAGLCAFSMLGANLSGTISAKAASTSTENSAFPTSDKVIAKAAELLGTPYTFGNKADRYAESEVQFKHRLQRIYAFLCGDFQRQH